MAPAPQAFLVQSHAPGTKFLCHGEKMGGGLSMDLFAEKKIDSRREAENFSVRKMGGEVGKGSWGAQKLC
jgi:hypothetical protein